MSQRQRVPVRIDRVVSDRQLDERALRAAIAAELGGAPTNRRAIGQSERAAAAAIARDARTATLRNAGDVAR